jgi:hypothetical protein
VNVLCQSQAKHYLVDVFIVECNSLTKLTKGRQYSMNIKIEKLSRKNLDLEMEGIFHIMSVCL